MIFEKNYLLKELNENTLHSSAAVSVRTELHRLISSYSANRDNPGIGETSVIFEDCERLKRMNSLITLSMRAVVRGNCCFSLKKAIISNVGRH